MKYFLAQVVCYAGDGVLWSKLYATDNPDVIRYIDEIAKADMETNWLDDVWGLGARQFLVVNEIKVDRV